MLRFLFRRSKPVEYQSPRIYKQMAVTPEAHQRMIELADKRGMSIIDTFDRLMGVK